MANDEVTKQESSSMDHDPTERGNNPGSANHLSDKAAPANALTQKTSGKRSRRKNRVREAITTNDRETAKAQESSSSPGVFGFANETKEELAKVVWPSRQQLISESIAVMLMVTLVATTIYLIDNFFAWGSGKVF